MCPKFTSRSGSAGAFLVGAWVPGFPCIMDGLVGSRKVHDVTRVLCHTGFSLATHAGDMIMLCDALVPCMRVVGQGVYTLFDSPSSMSELSTELHLTISSKVLNLTTVARSIPPFWSSSLRHALSSPHHSKYSSQTRVSFRHVTCDAYCRVMLV